jgi:hypothetical protein
MIPKVYQMLQKIAKVYQMLQKIAKVYQMLQIVRFGYKWAILESILVMIQHYYYTDARSNFCTHLSPIK